MNAPARVLNPTEDRALNAEQVALRVPADTEILTVTIDPDATPPVSPEVLPVPCASLIRFQLSPQAARSYEFAAEWPIVVHDGGNSFGPAHRRSDSLVTLRDHHSGDGDYRYSVHLVHRKTREPVTVDPVIRNEQ